MGGSLGRWWQRLVACSSCSHTRNAPNFVFSVTGTVIGGRQGLPLSALTHPTSQGQTRGPDRCRPPPGSTGLFPAPQAFPNPKCRCLKSHGHKLSPRTEDSDCQPLEG